ncbi:MAG: hypothetical protein ACI381_02260 [Candidatus Methanomethylophilaceae archaeon]
MKNRRVTIPQRAIERMGLSEGDDIVITSGCDCLEIRAASACQVRSD